MAIKSKSSPKPPPEQPPVSDELNISSEAPPAMPTPTEDGPTILVTRAVPTPDPDAKPEPPREVDPATVAPPDPDREQVVSDGPEFVVLAHRLGRFAMGDQITAADLGPHAEIKKLLTMDLPAIAPLPGVSVKKYLK